MPYAFPIFSVRPIYPSILILLHFIILRRLQFMKILIMKFSLASLYFLSQIQKFSKILHRHFSAKLIHQVLQPYKAEVKWNL
jgi:hypothetical protein